MEQQLPPPALGRRIALELRPARPLTWIGPAWATICGALASGAFAFTGESFLRIIIAVILTDPILGAWRAAWVQTDWRSPIRIWRATPTRSWMLVPYARLDSPAARLSQWLSSRAKFWREAIWPQLGQSISAIFVSVLIALTVALVLGFTTFLLTIIALILAPLEGELGVEGAGRWARGLAEIGFAWLIGYASLSLITPTLEATAVAVLFAIVYRGLLGMRTRHEKGVAISNGAQALIALLLIWSSGLVYAGLTGITLIAQMLWQALAIRDRQAAANYLGRVQWFVLFAMLVAALGVAH